MKEYGLMELMLIGNRLKEGEFDFSKYVPRKGKGPMLKSNRRLWEKFNALYPDLARNPKEFEAFCNNYGNPDFYKAQFCQACGKRTSYNHSAHPNFGYLECCSSSCAGKVSFEKIKEKNGGEHPCKAALERWKETHAADKKPKAEKPKAEKPASGETAETATVETKKPAKAKKPRAAKKAESKEVETAAIETANSEIASAKETSAKTPKETEKPETTNTEAKATGKKRGGRKKRGEQETQETQAA